MQKGYALFTIIFIASLHSALWSTDKNQPETATTKRHYFGRPGKLNNWSSDVSLAEIKEQFKIDAAQLALSIDKKFPQKICDVTKDCVFEKDPHPSTMEAMIIWTCRNWGRRAQGMPGKVIIKAAQDEGAAARWTSGLTYMIERAEYSQLKKYSILEGVPIVALTLKNHRYDPLVQRLDRNLLARLAAFEPKPLEKKSKIIAPIDNGIKTNPVLPQAQRNSNVQQGKTYAQALCWKRAQALNHALDCTPGQLVFEDPVAKQRKRESKEKRRSWWK
ncbi:hypothetical protein KBC04_05095 [Candidatus Babeliales bacterium]|nr:hypothetical protein [Candidatus Babeliales bacterium]MBP9844232.1 hypothetical protein [Candidatus Babeliales bacterium]